MELPVAPRRKKDPLTAMREIAYGKAPVAISVKGKLADKDFAPLTGIHPMLGSKVLLDIKADLMVDSDLDQELRDQPGLFAWYAQQTELAHEAYRAARYTEHCTREDLESMFRLTAETKGGRKPSEAQLKTMVHRHVRMRAAFEERMECEKRWEMFKGVLTALDQRSRMLASLAANQRREANIKDSF